LEVVENRTLCAERRQPVQSAVAGLDGNLSWYALQVRLRREFSIASALRVKGYEVLNPSYPCTRTLSDRKRTAEAPLFPGYLFCQIDLADRSVSVIRTPGVIRIVGSGPTPMSVESVEIDSLRKIMQSGLPARPHPYLPVGSRVEITGGPLEGAVGEILEENSGPSLAVSVSLLRRSVAVQLRREWLDLKPEKPAGLIALSAV
jgi:transcription antitermination factor NusG